MPGLVTPAFASAYLMSLVAGTFLQYNPQVAAQAQCQVLCSSRCLRLPDVLAAGNILAIKFTICCASAMLGLVTPAFASAYLMS